MTLPAAAGAVPLQLGDPLCYAVGSTTVPVASRFTCRGEPAGYAEGTLWLRAKFTPLTPRRPVVLVHQTRFDRLTVLFHYADGSIDRQEVARGDYGSHWRIGGQILFEAPERAAAPIGVTLGFDHLASDKLLRIRLLSRMGANRDLAIAAALAGGALTLLLISGLYNLSLAAAARRQSLAWHGLWAVCMVLWGSFWSQIALILLPQMAGTPASETCTLLACLAVAAGTISVATAAGLGLPRWLRATIITLAIAIALVGVPASLVTNVSIDLFGTILAFLILGDLGLVALCLGWSWRRGHDEARDLAKAWAVPMAALAVTQIFDINNVLFGGGPQIAVLLASALQTVSLSISSTLRLSTMRYDLEAARAAESALTELASRDPLTGLLNRRGFIDCLHSMFGNTEGSLGLLLIDLDFFKSINDRFGHEAGDSVLCRVADYFRELEQEDCASGRMGGEEFVLAVSGLTSAELARFAERVRAGLAACDHGEISRHRKVTVSIGVAEGSTRTLFQKLYAAADRALYEAKRSGRNQVRFASGANDLQQLEAFERDQLNFGWAAVSGDGPRTG